MTLAVTPVAGTLEGGAFLLSIDGSAPAARTEVGVGHHALVVTNPGDRRVRRILCYRSRMPSPPPPPGGFRALRRPPDRPDPRLGASELRGLVAELVRRAEGERGLGGHRADLDE